MSRCQNQEGKWGGTFLLWCETDHTVTLNTNNIQYVIHQFEPLCIVSTFKHMACGGVNNNADIIYSQGKQEPPTYIKTRYCFPNADINKCEGKW